MYKRFRGMKGFTMIELLVVIAVIGVLAVAVLSSINPLEQINKGRDTRVRSDAAELLNAIDRYFATQERFPWNQARTGGTNDFTAVATIDEDVMYDDQAASDWDWVFNLSDVSEVKDQFSQRVAANNDGMVLAKEDGGAMEPVHVCFQPSSNQFRLEAARKCCTQAACPGDDLAETAPTITGVTVCATTDGTIDEDNFICLP